MVKLSRCPLTSQGHDSPIVVKRGEHSTRKRDSGAGTKNRGEENVGIDARPIPVEENGHSAVNSSGKRGTILYTGTVGRLLLSRDGTWWRGAQCPEQSICLVVFAQGAPPERDIPAVFLCAFRVFVFLTPFSRRNWTSVVSGTGWRGKGSLGHCHPPSSPLHFSSSKLDKCSPLIIFPLSTSFHRNSNLLPGFFHVEN